MRRFFLKFQLVFEAIVLFATLVLVSTLLYRYNYRWDLTQEKVYSLPKATADMLGSLRDKRLDIYAFYLQDDPGREGLEIFLKECQRVHPEFHYAFYDPSRRPQLAKKFQITAPSTIIVQSGDREERILAPNEEAFTNAFLRIFHPKNSALCFVQGHGEVEIFGEEATGYQMFRKTLEGYNVTINEIVLSRDHVPDACQVVVVAGSRWELPPAEFADLKAAFGKGKGILLLLDPMDPGTGQAFIEFAKGFGVALGQNVIVDKASRIVGGDFLMPIVSQYFMRHPVSKAMKQATFFPLVRSVQVSSETVPGLEVMPLALTGAESWAETDLGALETGNTAFDMKTDVAGPLSIAVAVEQTTDHGPSLNPNDSVQLRQEPEVPVRAETTDQQNSRLSLVASKIPATSDQRPATHAASGRMIVIGDSDFLNNGYLSLAGNKEFSLRVIQWLAKDDRFVEVQKPKFKFKPLILDVPKQTLMIVSVLAVYPLVFFVLGGLYLAVRSRTS